LLALFLTYSAIAASYSATALPILIAQAREKGAEPPAAGKKGDAKPAPAPADPGPVAPPRPNPGAAAGAPAPEAAGGLTALGIVAGLVLLLGLYALPVLVGFQQPIGLLIVAFALWEAWKLNKRVPLVINGPFEVAKAPAPEELPPEGIASHA
jgi:hypothetical protein